MSFVLIEVGCLECGEETIMRGTFATEELAQLAGGGTWAEPTAALWASQTVLVIFDTESNKAVSGRKWEP